MFYSKVSHEVNRLYCFILLSLNDYIINPGAKYLHGKCMCMCNLTF